MPSFTDYEITVKTTVEVVIIEAGRRVSAEEFTVLATSRAGEPHRPVNRTIARLVGEAGEKTAPHTEAVQQNENTRRGV